MFNARHFISPAAVLAAIAAAFAPDASAQCSPTATQIIPHNTGVAGTVYAAVSWDPDGHGPEPEWLVIGGEFVAINGVEAHAVAAWDGTRWRSFGLPPLTTWRKVSALTVHQGRLLAAGDLWEISGTPVGGLIELTVDGWQLYEGRPGPRATFANSAAIRCMVSDGDNLYIGGGMLEPDGTTFWESIVRWDGLGYRSMGIQTAVGTDHINGLTIHNGMLHATGAFSGVTGSNLRNVARLDGKSWQSVGSGLDREGASIFSSEGNLYVGVGRKDGDGIRAFAWDGETWTPAGSAFDGTGTTNAWASLDGEVIAAVSARMSVTSGSSEMHTWALDGDAWRAVWPEPSAIETGPSYQTNALTHWRGDLIAAGARRSPTADRFTGGVAQLCDDLWTPIDGSLDGAILSLLPHGDGLIGVGTFTSAGGVFTPGAFAMIGDAVESLNAPIVFEGVAHSRVQRAIHWDDRLCLVGNFLTHDPASTGVLIRESTGEWVPAPHPYTTFDASTGAVVEDELYLVADTTGSGRRGLVALHASGSWRTVEPGTTAFNLYTTIQHAGDLYVGGSFTSLAGTEVSTIARFDGTSWRALGDGLSGSVRDLVVHQGSLIAAGNFTIRETGESARVARWNGVSWSRVPVPVTATVRLARSVGGRLFITAGPMQSFLWNAGAWQSIVAGPLGFGIEDVADSDGVIVALGTPETHNSRSFLTPFALDLPCAADYICDGVADIVDLLDFIQAYAECSDGVAACDPIRADFNQDGIVDILDFLDFFDAFGAGC